MSRLCVGIDAGGTNVRVRWNEGELRCAADPEGGPEPVLTLLAQVSVERGEISSICAGITKVSRGEVKASWEKTLAAAYPKATISVVPDYVVAFHGAIPEGVGLLCVAGTGSVIYGEDEFKKAVRVGGRGWEFGDEGSGAYVTTELMRRTLRACDGLWPHTALTKAVCGLLETGEAALVGERARQRARVEGRGFLVRLVHAKALEGDHEAQGLFTGAAGWLARFVRAAHEQLEFPSDSAVPVALVGGMWEQVGQWMHAPFWLLLERWEKKIIVREPMGSPVEGALRLAERSCS
ncbi:MAG: hypothetical protein NTX57_07630 [Armatimonadetes bacterium]|nr:hypothetical protein [Armatimonadota bacterium]